MVDNPLHDFIQTGSPDAFRRIVVLHASAVYSQSLRQLRDPGLASDATQLVFVTLAQKARRLPPRVVLAGWLFNATGYCCHNIRRAERRRCNHERNAMRMRNETIGEPAQDDLWSSAQPLLNDAIAKLGSADRDAVLLRFFHRQSLREVGAALGVSEDAAKQRVSRAVEKLRSWFAGRGVAAPSVVVATWLSAAVDPAPQHLLAAIKNTRLPVLSASRLGWSKIMSMKFAATGAALAVVACGMIAAIDAAPPHAVSSPETQPTAATSQASPLETMRKLSAALKANDLKAIDDCLTDDGEHPPKTAIVRACLRMNGAACRLTKSFSAAFGDQMRLKNFGFDAFPALHGGFETLIDRSLDASNGQPTVNLTGNVADIRVDVPSEALANGLPEQRAWAGAKFVFKQDGQAWKVNLDRSVGVKYIFKLNDPRGDADAAMLRLGNALTEQLNDVAAQIETGQIDSTADASAAVEKVARKAFEACGVKSASLRLVPATVR